MSLFTQIRRNTKKHNTLLCGMLRLFIKPLKEFILKRCAKYDLGVTQDPIHSFADLLTRYLYAKLYQAESFNLAGQVIGQYACVTLLFHMRRIIRKSGLGAIPIRVIFLAGDPLDWGSMDSVYRECKANKSFVVNVVHVGFIWLGTSTNCTDLFYHEKISYHDGINNRFRLDILFPDIIITSSPYDDLRPSWYETKELLRYAKLVYIPYGIDFSDGRNILSTQTFGYAAQRNAWRIFTRSVQTLDSYKNYAKKSSSSVIALGLPVMDQYLAQSDENMPPEFNERAMDKFKIIYAPHHTIGGWSTFLDYAEYIRDYIRCNEDCFLIFRPHPCLMGALSYSKLMTEQEFMKFFSGKNIYYSNDVNFNKVFRSSDLLISDASSFLVQYAPTKKPIIYLERQDGWGIDSTLSGYVYNSCYVARSEMDIGNYINQIKSGLDVMKDRRIKSQDQMCNGIHSGSAGCRIVDYISHELS